MRSPYITNDEFRILAPSNQQTRVEHSQELASPRASPCLNGLLKGGVHG